MTWVVKAMRWDGEKWADCYARTPTPRGFVTKQSNAQRFACREDAVTATKIVGGRVVKLVPRTTSPKPDGETG